ncbi:TetR/AcrR family transcriptional regulator [Microlunatus speluncae]|uniref:TetR/AcrR family transcriptional regulator n=1 Tax=Microlunatus speluncae TaxID=2594267 RepID=UPI001266438B|nr:TetR/AcrR family transcriptional regulator [Microlunatus speluncae]
MAKPRTPRRAWIDQGLRALASGGPDSVRVEVLAESLGVTKGGFYGYFADRPALLTEMLDTWELEVTDKIIQRVEESDGDQDARAKLRRLAAIVTEIDDDPTIGIAVELAVRDWARRDPEVAIRLRRIDDRHLAYLRPLYGELCADPLEVEAHCMIAMSLRLGDHLMSFDHGRYPRSEVQAYIQNRLITPG